MKKQILSIAFSSLLLMACNQAKNNNAESAAADTSRSIATTETAMQDEHNAQNSLDWQGTYKGVLPCADCEGIETVITLSDSATFVRSTLYLGKGDGKIFEENGTFTWDESGRIVTLNIDTEGSTQYFVGENTLTMLDVEGNKVTGTLAENYILKKQ